MFKKIVISLALGLVLDILIAFAAKKQAESDNPDNVSRWLAFIQILEQIKNNQNLLKL